MFLPCRIDSLVGKLQVKNSCWNAAKIWSSNFKTMTFILPHFKHSISHFFFSFYGYTYCIWKFLGYGSNLRWILIPLSEARNQTHFLIDTVGFLTCWSTKGTPLLVIFISVFCHLNPVRASSEFGNLPSIASLSIFLVYFFKFNFIGGFLISNIVLVLGVQQSESVKHINISILFFPYRLV